MIKEKLTLLNDTPNIFDFPQSTIDTFKIDDSVEKFMKIDTILKKINTETEPTPDHE